jgi:RsiW-degrading membrane proteinase PrsW (M82 family)
MAQATTMQPAATQRRNLSWLVALIAGTAMWGVSLLITEVTNDTILIPTIILLGSFVVPVTVVLYAMSRERADRIPAKVMFLGFIAGGTLGVLASALIETYYLPNGKGTYFVVGLIEEAAKALVLLAVAHQVVERGPRDGMVLGAIVGAGFAAFETSGYALTTLLKHVHDHPLMSIAQTEFSRGILAPFGHILWTALVGGALFESAQLTGAFRVTKRLALTFVGVVALHGLWDSSYGAAIILTQGLVGPGWEFTWPSIAQWVGAPTGDELHLFRILYDVLLLLNGLVGSVWVIRTYRTYNRRMLTGAAQVVVRPEHLGTVPDPHVSTH